MPTPMGYALKLQTGAICNCYDGRTANYCKRHKEFEQVIASAVADEREKALDEAIKAQCHRCREGKPVEKAGASWIHPNLTPCYASEIHGLKGERK